MADVTKKRRTQVKKNFTRALNTFNDLLKDDSPADLVKPQFDKLKSCWDKLEAAQDDVMEASDDLAEENFLDASEKSYDEALKSYSTYLKKLKSDEGDREKRKVEDNKLLEDERVKREAREKKNIDDARIADELENRYQSERAEFLVMVESLKNLLVDFKDSLVGVSDNDKRKEWTKVESNYKDVQKKLTSVSGLGHNKDLKDLKETFSTDAEATFKTMQKWILGELKDSSETSGGAARPSTAYSTKKESVHLPKFQGCEKSSPYLKFPTWKKVWDVMIVDYEPKYWYPILGEHLDEAARERYAGVEEYEEATKLLTQYYGDPPKVVFSASCLLRSRSVKVTMGL